MEQSPSARDTIDHLHLAGTNTKLLGGRLGQLGAGALSQLDLAGHYRDDAVFAQVNARRQAALSASLASVAAALRESWSAADRQQQARAERLRKGASVKAKRVVERGNLFVSVRSGCGRSGILFHNAARRTAFKIWG